MATRGGPETLFGLVGGGDREPGRLGQALVLFGLLSVAGGVGLVLLTEAYRFEEGIVLTYRRAAVGLAAWGVPAFLYGVATNRRDRQAAGVIGFFLATLAVIAFLITYPSQWDLATPTPIVGGTLGGYAAGLLLCAFAVAAALAGRDDAGEPEGETEFIWGSPPND